MTTVIYADALISRGRLVHDAELRFQGDTITAVGARGTLGALPQDAVVHELPGHILMPGLTNGHTHSAMTMLRGVNDDQGFMPWLQEVQTLEQHLTHADIQAGLELALLEMLSTGTVAFADMYYWDEALLNVVAQAGLRVAAAVATVAPQAVMFPGATSRSGSAELTHTEELAAKYREHPQVRVFYGPHAPYSVPREFFVEVIERSKKNGVPIHTHLAESPAETVQMLECTDMRPAEYMHELGLFTVETLVAHCVHLNSAEIAEMAACGVSMSHNPVSNLKLGNGVASFPHWLQHGAKVALGTDSVASNNALDLFAEMKLATILHRGVSEDPAAVTAASVFEVATYGGAQAIGFAKTGALEPGMFADIVAVDARDYPASALVNVLSHLVFTATGRDVAQVWVGGRHLYSNGEFLTLDAADIRARAAASIERIRAAAGLHNH